MNKDRPSEYQPSGNSRYHGFIVLAIIASAFVLLLNHDAILPSEEEDSSAQMNCTDRPYSYWEVIDSSLTWSITMAITGCDEHNSLLFDYIHSSGSKTWGQYPISFSDTGVSFEGNFSAEIFKSRIPTNIGPHLQKDVDSLRSNHAPEYIAFEADSTGSVIRVTGKEARFPPRVRRAILEIEIYIDNKLEEDEGDVVFSSES